MQCGMIWSHCIEVRQDRQRATFLCLGEKRAHAGGKWRKTLFKVKNYELAVSLNPNQKKRKKESWILFVSFISFPSKSNQFLIFAGKNNGLTEIMQGRFPPERFNLKNLNGSE